MPNPILDMNFFDTFLDADHAKESFPGREVVMLPEDPAKQVRPFRVKFPADDAGPITVEAYTAPYAGPYPEDQPKLNTVRFTPVQTEALRSGLNPGLTQVVGPPGTGKTDVAVQIIANLYHTFPEQRTLIVTHSNQALNDLFEKIAVLNIKERHLLRLGHASDMLETEKDFSRFGRVNYMLGKRLELLEEVVKLSKSLGLTRDINFTCESAANFYLLQVVSRWEVFLHKLSKDPSEERVKTHFPFNEFFTDAPGWPLFKGESAESDMYYAEGCYAHIKEVFRFLEECRAFELLRNSYDRGNYLLTRQAKIIAMTCTHAALKRHDFVRLGFEYDNLLMEESAQILEIETFIPMLLQEQKGTPRLKRVVLIGDHNQLPPVVKNMAFQKYSHFDQSLYTRFVRLQVPTVQLNLQGRARPTIANLYNWRYKELGDLPKVKTDEAYRLGNPGLVHEFQSINVEDFPGPNGPQGETEPNPYFFQNLGEAEYVCAFYKYLRLKGIAADDITILSTYNGQKHLLRDVINMQCTEHPLYGYPHKITTVDRYQGSQNKFILLSLVRTKTVGHVRDVRRLVVALSRAKLGLYVFCRTSLFETCYELQPAFAQLMALPVKPQLLLEESAPITRKAGAAVKKATEVDNLQHMQLLVRHLEQERFQTEQTRMQVTQ
jgi:intron-binding protein aquarius